MSDARTDALLLGFARTQSDMVDETSHNTLMKRLRAFEGRQRASTPARGTVDSSSMIRLPRRSGTSPGIEEISTGAHTTTWALKFISGKYEGGFFPLQEGLELLIGRESTLDMVLVDELISRRHARLTTFGGQIEVEDFGSTNGTFVNGVRVERASLDQGDRLMIGTSIMLITQAQDMPYAGAHNLQLTPGDQPAGPTASHGLKPATHIQAQMTGQLAEIPLPDLLQLLSATRKSGALRLEGERNATGALYLKEGRVIHATLEACAADKAFYRMVTWEHGNFVLETLEDLHTIPESLDASVDAMLMEAMRQFDELRALPDALTLSARVRPAARITAPLRALSPEELDVFEWALCDEQVGRILGRANTADHETMRTLLSLIKRGYLEEHQDE